MDPETDRWARIGDARANFRDLVDEVTQDDAHVYLLRYDKPVAVIVPVEWYENAKAASWPPERHPPGADAGPHYGEAAYLDDEIGGMT